jgi:E3 ubiquitin-protein ligase HUWE1
MLMKNVLCIFVNSTFRWALSNGLTINVEEGLEHPDLTDGTGEFLDAWLMLLEKMVNPKAILDSPHTITMKHGAIYKPFDPLKYLMTIHRVSTVHCS